MDTPRTERPLVLSMTGDGEIVLFIDIDPTQPQIGLILEPAMAVALGASLVNLAQKLLALKEDHASATVNTTLN